MIALLLGLLALGADGESSLSVDLDQARRRAQERAASLEIARAEEDAARARARLAAGQALPTVTGFASLNVGAGLTPFGFERPVPWQGGVGVQGSWTIVDPAQWVAAMAARRTAKGREAMRAWSEAQARRDVTVAYADVLAAMQVVDGLEQSAEDAARAAAAVEERVAAGTRPPADGPRAQADALDLRAQAEAARGELAAACATLQGLLDAEIDGRCTVREVDWAGDAPAEGPVVHPALEAATEASRAASATATSATLGQLPTLSAEGQAAQYAVPTSNGAGWSATVQLNVPLTAPTTGAADIAAARADRLRAEGAQEQQRRDLLVALVQSEARLEAARRALEARTAGEEAAERAWDRVDARFQEGLEDLTTWLAARRARVQAQVARAQAEAAVGIAIAEVEAARGVR